MADKAGHAANVAQKSPKHLHSRYDRQDQQSTLVPKGVTPFTKPLAKDLSDEEYERYQRPLDIANLPDGPDGSKILISQEYAVTRLSSFRRDDIEEIRISLLTGTNGTEGEILCIQNWQTQPSREVLATSERLHLCLDEIPVLVAKLQLAAQLAYLVNQHAQESNGEAAMLLGRGVFRG